MSTSHGKVLSDGTTLYTLKPGRTSCGTKCLKIWPAVVLPSGVLTASAGSGVTASKLGTVNVPGVGVQVTYGGKRLYRFYKDKAGQVQGNITDTWGKWAAVVVSKSGATSNSGSSNAGSGGASF